MRCCPGWQQRPPATLPDTPQHSPPVDPLPPLVRNIGNTAFWTFVPLVYCTKHNLWIYTGLSLI
eukprot:1086869-Prorocentrum_minimum.AAC.1